MLLCCLRCTLKPSASAIAISKLYQHFRVRDHPYGLQNSLPTLNPSCSLHSFMQLRHGFKARYGWVANPYRKSLLISLPTGTFTLQDTPSFPRRDNDELQRPTISVSLSVPINPLISTIFIKVLQWLMLVDWRKSNFLFKQRAWF